MEPTIIQNGGLFQMQHRHTKRDRKRLRLWQTVVNEFTQNFAILGVRAAEYLEPRNKYRLTTLCHTANGTGRPCSPKTYRPVLEKWR
jgi:hypothetical protein